MTKGLEAITSPVSTELRNGKQYYTYTKEDVDIAEKELKAPINLINKELRNARKLLPYDNYRCGYIDALITIKNKIKEQDNEK